MKRFFVTEHNRLMVQIDRVGLEKRDEILSEPGIEGCLVGPGDLSFSLGFPDLVRHRDLRPAAEMVFATCGEKGEKKVIDTRPSRPPDDTGGRRPA
jgi:2-keto-3-deoxy-L-rhamnonate aldolase RhmA